MGGSRGAVLASRGMEEDHVAALAPGTTFGRDFRVVRPLGVGGMGAVYVVEQISTGRRRALKVLHTFLVRDRKHRERFEQEAKVGAGIRSDHVVEVIGAGIDDDTGMPWLAMELLEGEDLLARVTKSGPFGPDEVARIYQQLCHAVGSAHAIGVVHRDLKPENIFLAESRSSGLPFMVKVLDFGIAKMIAEGRTRTTSPLGTPLWMSPEQTEPGGRICPATDVWALGLIAFWMLTGRSYWKGASDESVSPIVLLREVVLEPLEPASDRAASLGVTAPLPAGFDDWLARCLERDPEARFSDAAEAHDALAPILAAAVPSDRRASLVVTPLVDALGRTAPVTSVMSLDAPTESMPELIVPSSNSTTVPITTQQPISRVADGPTKVSPSFDDDEVPAGLPRKKEGGGRPWLWVVAAIAIVFVGVVGGTRYMTQAAQTAAQEVIHSARVEDQEEQEEKDRAVLREKISAQRARLDALLGATAPIPAGAFPMGADDGNLNEQPSHRVEVEAFELDALEVTVAQYELCVKAGKCKARGTDEGCNGADRAQHPANCVDRDQAAAFCTWAAKRLPTEEEWEYASRGTDGRAYVWGGADPSEGLCWRRGKAGTCPVSEGARDLGPLGVRGAAGNVREWTDSRYCPYSRKDCGAETWVIRGGAWSDEDPLGVRVTIRNGKPADYESANVGFRCARNVI